MASEFEVGIVSEGPRILHIQGDADVTAALVTAGDVAVRAGFNERGKNAIMTVVAELARNIVKYAQRGRLTFSVVEHAGSRGLEIEAVDQGPGIADVEQAMRDNFSTGKTLGLGLPGARRLMDEFSIASTPGRGTRVVARKWL